MALTLTLATTRTNMDYTADTTFDATVDPTDAAARAARAAVDGLLPDDVGGEEPTFGEGGGVGGASEEDQPAHAHAEAPMDFEEALRLIEGRFIASIPDADLVRPERLFFEMEQGWWFYEDHLADKHAHLPNLKFEKFARAMFQHCARLRPLSRRFDEFWVQFKEYQFRVPVYGAALLTADMSKVLLLTSFRDANSWGFPKGKVNQGENPLACALREVYEEVGYDASGLNPRAEDFIPFESRDGKLITIFIMVGAQEDYPFAPRVVKEIGEIRWWPLKAIRSTAQEVAKRKFWGVLPFLPRLEAWVKKRRAELGMPPLYGGGSGAPQDSTAASASSPGLEPAVAAPPASTTKKASKKASSGGAKGGKPSPTAAALTTTEAALAATATATASMSTSTSTSVFPVEEMFAVNKALREKERSTGGGGGGVVFRVNWTQTSREMRRHLTLVR